MKKAYSFSLEEDLFKYVNNLAGEDISRSEILSRIILYYQFAHKDIAIDNIKATSNVPEVKLKKKKEDPTKNSIIDIYSQMKNKENSQ